jgi:hypothetical protein
VTTHKFKVGETVELHAGRLGANVPRGLYRIERLLPVESGNVQYRVKHVRDGHERVVAESHLSILHPLQPEDAVASLPGVPRTSRAEGGLRWAAPDRSLPQKKASRSQ